MSPARAGSDGGRLLVLNICINNYFACPPYDFGRRAKRAKNISINTPKRGSRIPNSRFTNRYNIFIKGSYRISFIFGSGRTGASPILKIEPTILRRLKLPNLSESGRIHCLPPNSISIKKVFNINGSE